MSVLPVTDALRRLEADGLVETRARAGTRVRVPTAADIHNLYELREALESQSARLFAERATAAQRRGLANLGHQVDSLFNRLQSAGNDAQFRFRAHSRHVRFHMTIAEQARSPLLTRAIERSHVLILNWVFDVGARRTPLPADFHTRWWKRSPLGIRRRPTPPCAHTFAMAWSRSRAISRRSPLRNGASGAMAAERRDESNGCGDKPLGLSRSRRMIICPSGGVCRIAGTTWIWG